MIEGARLLPLFREANSRKALPAHLLDCSTCIADRPDEEERRNMGCGYTTPRDEIRKDDPVWGHPAYRDAYGAPTVCPGYTVKLPAVLELAPLKKHWDKHTLELRYGDLDEVTWKRLDIYDSACDFAEAYAYSAKGKTS